MTRALLMLSVSACLFVGGCAQWDSRPELPVRHSMVLDQLVIFSQTPLPRNHRLLEELRALRTAVSTKLGLPISDEPVHVYLFPSAEKFTEYMRAAHPELPRRRAFFVETDTRLSVYAYWGDRVAEDLRHEVVHGYLHSVVPNLPLWLDEGLAEYFEVPRGTMGINRAHVEQLVQRGENWQPDMKRLEALHSTAEMKQADYAESWAWLHYLLESTPQNRELLRGYVQELMQPESPGALSDRVYLSDPRCRQRVAEHVAVLRQSLQ
ncbi:MAG: DUF1570 domain-containing protein [Planctomycetota bacterium]|nr:MAG: DUF1570 domain-containing protein [Planctomycetota bacterium]